MYHGRCYSDVILFQNLVVFIYFDLSFLIFLNILLMHIIELVLVLKISETLLAESNAIISRPINQSINQTRMKVKKKLNYSLMVPS